MTSPNESGLGEYLRHAREAKGITIEQVASVTRISVKNLLALESDHYADLPAKPFVRGFVASYAKFVGLDPNEVLFKFDAFLTEKVHSRAPQSSALSEYVFEKREGEQSRRLLWTVMLTFGFLSVIGFAFFKPKHRSRRHHGEHGEKTAEKTPVASPSASPLPSPSATPSPSPSPSPKPSPSPVVDSLQSGADLKPEQIKQRILLKTDRTIGVRYRSDSRRIMSFVLKKGRQLALRAETSLLLQISDKEGVTININNQGSVPFADVADQREYLGGYAVGQPAEVFETEEKSFEAAAPLAHPVDEPAASPSPSPSAAVSDTP